MQCAGGLQDGATRCAQLLNMLHDPSKSRPLNPVYVPSPGYMSALTNVTFQHANSFIIGTAVINTLDYPRRGVTPANTQETIGSPPPLVKLGLPAAPQAPIFQDPLPTAAGYYAETGTDRDSGNLFPPPPLRFTKE